jgi:hypothetical protein
MNKFLNTKGAQQAPNLGHPVYEFMSKAGNFADSLAYQSKPTNQIEQFFLSFQYNPEQAFKALMWLRDPRGGAGQRRLFRELLHHTDATAHYSEWIHSNVDKIVEYGRWDDVLELFATSAEQKALSLISDAVNHQNRLACKWMPRPNKKVSKKTFSKSFKIKEFMGLSNQQYRQLLVNGTDVVETKMSENHWDDIELNGLPGMSMLRHSKAFEKHIPEKWNAFVESKSTKVKATAIYPHEIMRMLKAQVDHKMIQKTWTDMLDKNLLSSYRILPVIDQSASMYFSDVGSLNLGEIAAAIGMYVSELLPGRLHRRFVTFSSRPEIVHWANDTLAQCYITIRNKDALNTNVEAVFDTLLDYASALEVSPDQMPQAIMIISDMQFDCSSGQIRTPSQTVIEHALQKWDKTPYQRPALIFWNLAGYAGQPVAGYENTAFISGFSPAILVHLFASMSTDAEGRLYIDYDRLIELALAKYDVVNPAA